jgi:hypothetical protein
VRARLDRHRYPTGKKISKKELRELRIERDDFQGDWNYVIGPLDKRNCNWRWRTPSRLLCPNTRICNARAHAAFGVAGRAPRARVGTPKPKQEALVTIRCRRTGVPLRAPIQPRSRRTRARAGRLTRARAVRLPGGARARSHPRRRRTRHPSGARRGLPLPLGGAGLDGLARALRRPGHADAPACPTRVVDARVLARRRRSPLAVGPARLDLRVARALRCGWCADAHGSVGSFDVRCDSVDRGLGVRRAANVGLSV